jgi:protein-disulfide isomerase
MTRTAAVLLLATLVAPRPGLHAQDSLVAPRAMGKPDAPVTVYEMGDFECPFCRDFALNTFPTIEKDYITTGKVYWVFINFPLTSIHPNAEASAEFAACALKEGKFWEAHTLLYQTQDQWAPLKNPQQFFISQIPQLGLNQQKMMTCLQSGAGREFVASDAALAERSGAKSTPTFYIEGGLLVGNQPLKIFQHVLDSIYTVKTAGH